MSQHLDSSVTEFLAVVEGAGAPAAAAGSFDDEAALVFGVGDAPAVEDESILAPVEEDVVMPSLAAAAVPVPAAAGASDDALALGSGDVIAAGPEGPIAPVEEEVPRRPNRGPANVGALRQKTREWAGSINFSELQLGASIGHGGFGATRWLDNAGKPLVLKTALKNEGRAQLVNEAAQYLKLGDHKNLPKCFGICEIEEQEGLVIEGIDGKDLEDSVFEMEKQYASGKMSHEEYFGTLQYQMSELVDVIELMASMNVVHHDLRSANIMVEADTGAIKLVDFGLSQTDGQRPKNGSFNTGAVAPEMLRTDVSIRNSDMFSAGAVAYRASEKGFFDYNASPGMQPVLAAFAFAVPKQPAGAAQAAAGSAAAPAAPPLYDSAVKVGGPGPAFDMVDAPPSAHGASATQKIARRKKGRYDINTTYSDFLSKMMHPDPAQRLSPAAARAHPFLVDTLMPQDQAKAVLSRFLKKEARPAAPAPAAGTAGAAAGAGRPDAAATGKMDAAVGQLERLAAQGPVQAGLKRAAARAAQRSEAVAAPAASPAATAAAASRAAAPAPSAAPAPNATPPAQMGPTGKAAANS